MGKHVRNRRQLRRIGLTALAVVLGVGVWQGVAGATATGGKTVKIQHHNANCGRSVGTPSIGTATFHRDGNTVSVDVSLTNADPDSDFFVILYLVKSNGGCKLVEDMGEIETDDFGMAQGEYSSQVDPKGHKFFIDISVGDTVAPTHGSHGGPPPTSPFDNDSLIVNL